MGNGSSIDPTRVVYLQYNGRQEKIVFSRHCSSRDIVELLAQAAGVSRFAQISLKNGDGAHVSISPAMPINTPSEPYTLEVKEDNRVARNDQEMFNSVLTQVAEQFNRAFKVEEMKNELAKRLSVLEKRMEIEGLKLIEVEKCRKDISDIKEQIYNAQKKIIDYNRLSEIGGQLYNSQDRPRILDESPHRVTEEEKNGKNVKKPKKSIPSFQKYTLSQETIDYLKQPTFDIWHWEPNEMLSLLEHMYHELGLVAEFNINPVTLKRWLLCVQENYRNNPFHNFRHCFCVTQMMYGMINLCKLWERMSREDLGILMTACVCHDLDHPGYNNTYQINARTELAIRYNDMSPLENHHCAVAFKILSNPETNIFSNVDANNFKRIRAGVTMLILATDMARHNDILESFKKKLSEFNFHKKDHVDAGIILLILATDMARHGEIIEGFKQKLEHFDFTSEEHLNSLKMVLIKCCDISNEVRPMEVSEPWVDCLLEEYFNQSDREKQEGLPVAPFMDREKVTKPSAQIGFIKFVLIPMFETVSKLFPQIEGVMVNPLKQARDHYEDLKREEETGKDIKKTSITDAEKAKALQAKDGSA